MRSLWNVGFGALLLVATLLLVGCGDSSGAEQKPVDVQEDTNTTDTAQDTSIDTSTPPPVTGPSRMGVVSGAASLSSDNYRLSITVGGPVSSHRLESSQYSLTLGVGATP